MLTGVTYGAFGLTSLSATSAGAYGWSDGLPHSLLSPSSSRLSLSRLCASFFLLRRSAGKWMGLLFAAFASHSVKLRHASARGGSVCMRVLGVQADPQALGFTGCVSVCVCECVWPGHLVLCMQAWNRLISCLQKLAIKSWSACQFKWNEMEPESN